MSPEQENELLRVARAVLEHAVATGHLPHLDTEGADATLMADGACFVTLQLRDNLRGCIGSLEAWRPLLDDVAANAYAAAFHDPRFVPLTEQELGSVTIQISVLNPPLPMVFDSEDQLLAMLRPGVDGLIIRDRGRHATFLPSVWEQLPEPRLFLAHLKQKAGMAPNHWSPTFTAERYTVESFSE